MKAYWGSGGLHPPYSTR